MQTLGSPANEISFISLMAWLWISDVQNALDLWNVNYTRGLLTNSILCLLFFMTTWFDFLQDVVLIFNKFNHFRNRMKHKNIRYSFQKRQLPVAFVVHSGVQQSTHQSTSRQLDSVMNNMESSFLGHKPKIKYSLLSPTRKKRKNVKIKSLIVQLSNK